MATKNQKHKSSALQPAAVCSSPGSLWLQFELLLPRHRPGRSSSGSSQTGFSVWWHSPRGFSPLPYFPSGWPGVDMKMKWLIKILQELRGLMIGIRRLTFLTLAFSTFSSLSHFFEFLWSSLAANFKLKRCSGICS